MLKKIKESILGFKGQFAPLLRKLLCILIIGYSMLKIDPLISLLVFLNFYTYGLRLRKVEKFCNTIKFSSYEKNLSQ